MKTFLFLASTLAAVTATHAFLSPFPQSRSAKTSLAASSSTSSYKFKDFQTSHGEVVHPYLILNVDRTATYEEIKRAFEHKRSLYHPSVLCPGSCKSVKAKKADWERIQLSYEILTNPKLRLRYNRIEVFDNLSGQLEQAGDRILNAGFFAVEHMVKDAAHMVKDVANMVKKLEQKQSEWTLKPPPEPLYFASATGGNFTSY